MVLSVILKQLYIYVLYTLICSFTEYHYGCYFTFLQLYIQL